MGGGSGNKAGYKGDDAEDMCGSTLEPDPRYDSCCSNIFRPGKVLRDIVKGLLVVLAIAVVIAVVFVIIFYVVPGKEGAQPVEHLNKSAIVGRPAEHEVTGNGISEVEFTDNTRYDVAPNLESIREEEDVDVHAGHDHDHEHHDHEHPDHDHTHHDHTHHDHAHHDHVHKQSSTEPAPEPEAEPEAEPEPASEPEPEPEAEPEAEPEVEPEPAHMGKEEATHDAHEAHHQGHSEGESGREHGHLHEGHDMAHDHTHHHDDMTHAHTHAEGDMTHDHTHDGDMTHDHTHDGDMTHDHTHDGDMTHDHTHDGDMTHDHTHDGDMTHAHTHDGDMTHDHTHAEGDMSHDHTSEFGHEHVHADMGHDQTATTAHESPEATPSAAGPTEITIVSVSSTGPGTRVEVKSSESEVTHLPPTSTPSLLDVLGTHAAPAEDTNGNCRPRSLEMCSDLPYALTSLPNWANDKSDYDLHNASLPFFRDVIVRSSCSPRAREYSCAILEPQCGANGAIIPPCRTFCRSVASTCQEFVIKGFGLSDVFECDRFPDSTDPAVCFDATQEPCLGLEHRCGDGKCVAKRLVCDGISDCVDQSDEATCPGRLPGLSSSTTPASETPEPLTSFPGEEVATTIPEYATEEDAVTEGAVEETTFFTTAPQTCPELTCLDGTCLLFAQLNDGVNDCADGMDEQNFAELIS